MARASTHCGDESRGASGAPGVDRDSHAQQAGGDGIVPALARRVEWRAPILGIEVDICTLLQQQLEHSHVALLSHGEERREARMRCHVENSTLAHQKHADNLN